MASSQAFLWAVAFIAASFCAVGQPIASTTANDLSGFSGTALAPYAAALSQAAPPIQEVLSNDPLFDEAKADPPLAATDPNLDAYLNDPVLLSALRTSKSFPELLAALPPEKAATLQEFTQAPATGDATTDELTIQKILGTAPAPAPSTALSGNSGSGSSSGGSGASSGAGGSGRRLLGSD